MKRGTTWNMEQHGTRKHMELEPHGTLIQMEHVARNRNTLCRIVRAMRESRVTSGVPQ